MNEGTVRRVRRPLGAIFYGWRTCLVCGRESFMRSDVDRCMACRIAVSSCSTYHRFAARQLEELETELKDLERQQTDLKYAPNRWYLSCQRVWRWVKGGGERPDWRLRWAKYGVPRSERLRAEYRKVAREYEELALWIRTIKADRLGTDRISDDPTFIRKLLEME